MPTFWKRTKSYSHFGVNLVILIIVSYRQARFTPPSAKYLILDDFHFRIDPQIINYNGLSFHTSMGLPELGRAADHQARCAATARWPGRGRASPGPRRRPAAQAHPPRLQQLSNHNRTISAKASLGSTAICWSTICAFSLKPTFRWAWATRSHVLLRLNIRIAQACFNLNHISGNLREEQLKGAHWVGHGYCHDHQLLQESHTCWYWGAKEARCGVLGEKEGGRGWEAC